MAFEFCVLSSGSKANCLFFTDGATRLLIDCGLSGREAAKRLALVGVDPSSIDAIVVTHEHGDHIGGVAAFAKRYQSAVFANHRTAATWAENTGGLTFPVHEFEAGHAFSLGEIEVEPFRVSHDAADPIMVRLRSKSRSLAIMTDLGQLTNLVREKAQGIDALVLESNHDPLLLQEASYPWEVKQRIKSTTGHLSNAQAGELVREMSEASSLKLQVLVGAHVSEQSNHESLVLESFEKSWQEGGCPHTPEMLVAGVSAPTRMFSIR